MRSMSNRIAAPVLVALLAASASVVSAQEQDTTNPNIIVNGQEPQLDMSAMTKGPEIKGTVTARRGDRIRVTAARGGQQLGHGEGRGRCCHGAPLTRPGPPRCDRCGRA